MASPAGHGQRADELSLELFTADDQPLARLRYTNEAGDGFRWIPDRFVVRLCPRPGVVAADRLELCLPPGWRALPALNRLPGWCSLPACRNFRFASSSSHEARIESACSSLGIFLSTFVAGTALIRSEIACPGQTASMTSVRWSQTLSLFVRPSVLHSARRGSSKDCTGKSSDCDGCRTGEYRADSVPASPGPRSLGRWVGSVGRSRCVRSFLSCMVAN